MRYKNLCEKYDLTIEEIQEGINFISGKNCLGDFCNINLLLAITDLLINGDIQYED